MSNQKIKTIFIGTSNFGVESLRQLIKCPDFDIAGVITQPNKKVGRKQELTPSPIKQEVQKYGLNVWQPELIKNFNLVTKNLDIIIVIAYGQILPENIFDILRC